jgi:hypothetical protein
MDEHSRITSSVILQRAVMWAGLILAQAILLREIASPTTWLHVCLLTLTAFAVDQPLLSGKLAARRWGGLAQAGSILAVAIVLRVVVAL